MSQNATDFPLIIATDNNPEKALQTIKKKFHMVPLCFFLVLCGLLFAVVGSVLIGDLTRYSDDFDKFTAFAAMALGVVAMFVGIAGIPLMNALVKNSWKNSTARVYGNHVEGTGVQISGTAQVGTEFYETYDRISSVSGSENAVLLHMKDGRTIRCMATNAKDVVAAIHTRIRN